MTDSDWLDGLPVIGELPPEVAAVKLREVGEDELAQALAEAPEAAPEAFGVPAWLRIGGDRAWQHTAHAVGYLAPAAGPQAGLLEIQHAGNIAPDEGLKGARVKLTLDGLRVADYPGRGMHRVLFDFAARNQTDQGAEQLHFSTAYPVREGEEAAVLGRPISPACRPGRKACSCSA